MVRGQVEVVLSLDVLIEEVVLAGVRTLAAVVGAERYEAAGEFVVILLSIEVWLYVLVSDIQHADGTE